MSNTFVINYDIASLYSHSICPELPTDILMLRVKPAYRGEWCIDVHQNEIAEVAAWCKETFGEPGQDRNMYRWRRTYMQSEVNHVYKIFLRSEADVLLFTLKWVK